MAETIAESARKASAGSWRKPRMKIYDYNQEFGGNYYQPMIEYINTKNIQGPFHQRKEIYMPNQAEVTSDKFTNMRYNDKSSTSLDFENFLVDAYAKQIKELNSSTAMARINMIKAAVSRRTSAHAPMDNVTTPYNPIRLLKGAPPGQERVNYYASELNIMGQHNREQEKANKHHLFEIESYGKYDYHHNVYKPGVDRNRKFWEPEKIADYVGRM